MKNPLLEKLANDPKRAMELVPYKIGTLALPKILLVLTAEATIDTETSAEELVRDFVSSCVFSTVEKIILEELLR